MSKRHSISGWGLRPRVEATRLDLAAAGRQVPTDHGYIPRGLGRSYGDSALAPHVLDCRRMDRLIEIDEAAPHLVAEAGVSLWDLNRILTPRGLAMPVAPGTQFVTLGGMVASDVHGKNHHIDGSMAEHVLWLDLALPDGTVRRCSRDQSPDLFAATCGGMGLTGVVLRLCVKLQRIRTSYILQKTIKLPDLSAVMQRFEDHADWPYSVAWIDCLATGAALGRSVLMLGRRAEPDELQDRDHPLRWPKKRLPGIPFHAPRFVLNRWTMRAFNSLYFRAQRAGEAIVDAQSFFHPLDAIANWNRLYGRQGFYQYQFVLPLDSSEDGLRRILQTTTQAGKGSFLSVLKRLGPGNDSPLSFPMEGYTLALDFAWHPTVHKMLAQLDDIVAECGGRIYLTKDARMPVEMLRKGYPKLDEFLALRQRIDPDRRLSSLQSTRLDL